MDALDWLPVGQTIELRAFTEASRLYAAHPEMRPGSVTSISRQGYERMRDDLGILTEWWGIVRFDLAPYPEDVGPAIAGRTRLARIERTRSATSES